MDDYIADPRTKLVKEVFVTASLMLAIHGTLFGVCFPSNGYLTESYLATVCVALPLVSIAITIYMVRCLRWTTGPSILFMVISTMFSVLQLLLWAEGMRGCVTAHFPRTTFTNFPVNSPSNRIASSIRCANAPKSRFSVQMIMPA